MNSQAILSLLAGTSNSLNTGASDAFRAGTSNSLNTGTSDAFRASASNSFNTSASDARRASTSNALYSCLNGTPVTSVCTSCKSQYSDNSNQDPILHLDSPGEHLLFTIYRRQDINLLDSYIFTICRLIRYLLSFRLILLRLIFKKINTYTVFFSGVCGTVCCECG